MPSTEASAASPSIREPAIVRRSLECGGAYLQIIGTSASGGRPPFQGAVKTWSEDQIESFSETVVEGPEGCRQHGGHVGFSEVLQCHPREEPEEEVFEDDFETDEEPPSPRGSSWQGAPGLGRALDRDCWGRLISLTPEMPNIDLTTKAAEGFSLGRSSKCTFAIDDPHVSAVQFTLTMYDRAVCEVEIRDQSSNGTYCNAEKVGKGRAKALSNGDEITFQVCKAAGTVFIGYLFQFLSPNLHDVRRQQYRHGRDGDGGSQQRGRRHKMKYKISDVLGRGGFATVYLGMNQDTGELIAVKRIPVAKHEAAKIKAVCKEIDLLRSLSHSKVVQYLGYEVEPGCLNILLEYVPGGSIAALLQKFGEFDENVIRIYTLQILIGLNFLHDNHVLHRDIKGANILVTQRGTVKLTDFGSARATIASLPGKDAGERSLGDLGRGLEGTVLWMAPEVAAAGRYSPSSDVWGVACTIIEMATNALPWAEESLGSYASAMCHIATATRPPRVPATLGPAARAFLEQCLRLDPGERPGCGDLLRHPFITQAAAPSPELSPPATAAAAAAASSSPLAASFPPPHSNALSFPRPSSQHVHQVFLQRQAELQQSQQPIPTPAPVPPPVRRPTADPKAPSRGSSAAAGPPRSASRSGGIPEPKGRRRPKKKGARPRRPSDAAAGPPGGGGGDTKAKRPEAKPT